MGDIRLGGIVFIPPPTSLPYTILEEGEADGNYNVWRVIDGVPTRLTNYTDDTGVSPPYSDEMNNARLSPDGQWVVYNENFPDGSVIDVVDATAGNSAPTRIYTDDPDNFWTLHPSWHPDSDQIIFVGEKGGGFAGDIIHVERTDPLGTATTLFSPNVQSPQRDAVYRPHYSPDGTQIAFLYTVEGGGGGTFANQGLWVMDADGSNDSLIRSLASASSAERGYVYSGTQLAWSNDSEWIAFGSKGTGGGDNNIYKIRPDGTDELLLAQGEPVVASTAWRVGHGAWVEDDSAIIATKDIPLGGWEVHRVEADGSGSTILVPDGSGPDGQQHFQCAYRHFENNRIYFIQSKTPGILVSCAIDGSDLQTEHEIVDPAAESTSFFSGTGIEWL